MIKYQKVIKVGNSLAVTLDPKFISQANIQAGDQVAVSYKSETGVISIAKTTKKLANKTRTEKAAVISARVNPEFQKWVEQSLKEDEEAMVKLKDL